MKKPKTARFAELVKKSGQPELVVLWTKPEDNPAFMKAVAQNRVMTIAQPNVGTRRDFGLVGFFPQRNANYAEFPKPLEVSRETKVVGIRYEDLQQSKPSGPLYKPGAERPPGIPMRERGKKVPKPPAQPPKAPAPPKTRRFAAEITWTSTVTETITVEAVDAKNARKLIERAAQQKEPDFRSGAVESTIGRVKAA